MKNIIGKCATFDDGQQVWVTSPSDKEQYRSALSEMMRPVLIGCILAGYTDEEMLALYRGILGDARIALATLAKRKN